MSKPVQVYLDDDDLARLERCSRERGWTKSQVVRAALRALTRTPERDPLLAASGMIDGLPADASERFDDYLNQTYVAERPPPYGARRRRAKPVRR
jgi:Arc/MetJ family transcription regulator